MSTARGVAADRRGFVLVAALWLLVALGAVGLHAGLEMRTERLAAANVLDEVRARQAALAGAEYARSRLTAAMLDRADELRAQAASGNQRQQRQSRTLSVQAMFRSSDPSEDPWRDPEGLVVRDMAFGGARFSVRLRDVGAALDPNNATEEMLLGFFSQGLALDYAQADRLTQAILDWRDDDDFPRLGGAEREEYLRAGAAVLPSNGPFASLDEIRHVFGMTQDIFEAALPHLTLVASAQINVNTAPAPVLLALPGMTPAAAEEIVRMREAGVFPSSRVELLQMLPAGAAEPLRAVGNRFTQRADFRTNLVEILSDGLIDGSPVQARVRVVVLRSNSGAQILYRVFN